jgi:hypothetical protein
VYDGGVNYVSIPILCHGGRGRHDSVSHSRLDLLFGLAARSVLSFSGAADFGCRSIARLGFACTALCFRFDSSFPNSVPRAKSFPIAMWSWPS